MFLLFQGEAMLGAGLRFLACPLIIAAICGGSASAYCPGTDPGWPGSSPNYYSARKEYARSAYVIHARVLAATWLDERGRPTQLKPPFLNGGDYPWGFDPYLGVKYRVKVLASYKGAPQAEMTLFSENTTERFVLSPKADYLLFVTRSTFDKPVGQAWTIDTCGKSEPWKPHSPTLRQTRMLTGDKPGSH